MKQVAILACTFFLLSVSAKAQSTIKLDYFTKVVTSISNCGAMYTYDSVPLQKKKYILLTDFQNLGLIMVNGKQIKLQLTDSKVSNKNNITTYKGAGYTVILTYLTTAQKGEWDFEAGTVQIKNGTRQQTIKIHGQSHCDETKQEGNL